MRLSFNLKAEARESRARAATFQTLHGEVRTPLFMPVGTQATVKSQTVEALREAGSTVLLANTYHLLLRPGIEVFQRFGGIHRFMNWSGPVLTDSGGFQIFSLPHARQMTEEGARFQSYVDGREHLLSPEESIRMQRAIGSDIMMVLDQCIPSTAGHDEAADAMHLTHRWARRSLDARGDSLQAMFGIVQGACFHDLRRESAAVLAEMPFDGFAIGGLAVGETKERREEFIEATACLLPRALPRYLMGVGAPIDILEAVHRGVDMFDCIIPTKFAQRGVAFTSHGKMQFRRTVYKFAEEALDADCSCPTCKSYSRAYLSHLVKSSENLGWFLLAQHNLHFYHRLMREMREAILSGTFAEFYRSKRGPLSRSDEDNPVVPPRLKRIRIPRLGNYEVHLSSAGFASIKQTSSGEIMHSVSEPSEEAARLYIEQSGLVERLKNTVEEAAGSGAGAIPLDGDIPPLVVWDVGLGAATNAMAAIRAFESLPSTTIKRSLKIISFERDLDSLKLAAKHMEHFHHLRHEAPHRLLNGGCYRHRSGLCEWELRHGDFLAHLELAPVPEIIFYDPFSFKVDSELWTEEVFSRIYRHCAGAATELFTYSASTAVRGALLAAGFFVAKGVGTGPKRETTIALVRPHARASLLGEDWLKRWSRSDAKVPASVPEALRAAFEARIQNHPQFAS